MTWLADVPLLPAIGVLFAVVVSAGWWLWTHTEADSLGFGFYDPEQVHEDDAA